MRNSFKVNLGPDPTLRESRQAKKLKQLHGRNPQTQYSDDHLNQPSFVEIAVVRC